MSFLGYVVGMMATEAAMHYANHAQPALLYLVPAVLISLLLAAAVRGELNAMWEYTEEEDEDQEVEEKSGKDVEKKKRRGSSFSPSRSAKVADEIASALSVPEKGAAGKDGDKQPAPPEEQSLPTVRGPAHTFRRDRERDIVFLSVGRTGSWKSRRPRSQRRPAPKWVVPPHEREELNDVVGHAGKRLRMA
jgi:minor histocompatibility antigen H13